MLKWKMSSTMLKREVKLKKTSSNNHKPPTPLISTTKSYSNNKSTNN